MKITIKQRFRNIETVVVLCRLEWEAGDWCDTPGDYWYQLECLGHGEVSEEYAMLKDARAAMREPETWCRGCQEGWPVDEEAMETVDDIRTKT